jgi:hypothetical protein
MLYHRSLSHSTHSSSPLRGFLWIPISVNSVMLSVSEFVSFWCERRCQVPVTFNRLIHLAFHYTRTSGAAKEHVACPAFLIGCWLLFSRSRLGFHLQSSPFISPPFHIIHLKFGSITLGAIIFYLALTFGLHETPVTVPSLTPLNVWGSDVGLLKFMSNYKSQLGRHEFPECVKEIW